MNAVPIKTWIDDPDDNELENCFEILDKLSVVDDVPKVMAEILKRKIEFSGKGFHKLIESQFISSRGNFNSPIHANVDKKFVFT